MNEILEKLAKIKAQADGAEAIGSQEEAKAFAAKLQQLLIKHKLSLSDVEYMQLEKEEDIAEFIIDWEAYDLPVSKKRSTWITYLGNTIAQYHGCLVVTTPGINRMGLIGRESNCKIAEYILVRLIKSCQQMAQEKYNELYYQHWKRNCLESMKGFKKSFYFGFASAVGGRLKEQLKEVPTETSTALVRVGNEIEEILSWVESSSKYKKAKPASISVANTVGLTAGQIAGRKVNLNANGLNANKKWNLN